jgi:hypothetical protein
MTGRAWIVVLAAMTGASCAAATTGMPLASAGDRMIAAASRGAAAANHRAAEPLTIDVYPRIMSAGGHASVRLRIEPNALARTLEISWWSGDGLGGSHQISVDGDRAPIRYQFPLKHVEPGEYEVTAVLMRADGSRVRRTTTMVVVGPI